jgi:hypothetical protein
MHFNIRNESGALLQICIVHEKPNESSIMDFDVYSEKHSIITDLYSARPNENMTLHITFDCIGSSYQKRNICSERTVHVFFISGVGLLVLRPLLANCTSPG